MFGMYEELLSICQNLVQFRPALESIGFPTSCVTLWPNLMNTTKVVHLVQKWTALVTRQVTSELTS